MVSESFFLVEIVESFFFRVWLDYLVLFWYVVNPFFCCFPSWVKFESGISWATPVNNRKTATQDVVLFWLNSSPNLLCYVAGCLSLRRFILERYLVPRVIRFVGNFPISICLSVQINLDYFAVTFQWLKSMEFEHFLEIYHKTRKHRTSVSSLSLIGLNFSPLETDSEDLNRKGWPMYNLCFGCASGRKILFCFGFFLGCGTRS